MTQATTIQAGGRRQAAGDGRQAAGATAEIRSHKDLEVWQRSFQLALSIYKLTKGFPSTEIYGLTSQMRRAAFSVPANIAEGYRRRGQDYIRFLRIASGSASELETYLLAAEELQLGDAATRSAALNEVDAIVRMISRLIDRLQ